MARPGAVRAAEAWPEVLVALLLLVPLALAVVYVARWHDLQHTTIAAARHAAFESESASGRIDAAEVGAATRRRFFTRDPGRFAGAAGDGGGVANLPQWRDHAGRNSLVDAGGLDARLAAVAQPADVASTERAALAMIAPARAVGGPPFDLQRDAARSASVALPVWHAPGFCGALRRAALHPAREPATAGRPMELGRSSPGRRAHGRAVAGRCNARAGSAARASALGVALARAGQPRAVPGPHRPRRRPPTGCARPAVRSST